MVRLLITDDEEVVRNTMCNMLQPLGLNIFTAENAAQAIEMTRREFFDVALLDIKIPDMDGIQLMQELKNINPNLRCIMLLTGLSDVQLAVSAVKKGAFDYIPKPFKEQEVLKAVNDALQSMFGPDKR